METLQWRDKKEGFCVDAKGTADARGVKEHVYEGL
jgi:hypothetical protein